MRTKDLHCLILNDIVLNELNKRMINYLNVTIPKYTIESNKLQRIKDKTEIYFELEIHKRILYLENIYKNNNGI